jgi:hypothetical protein
MPSVGMERHQPDSRGRFVLTWRCILLTYAGWFTGGVEHAIDALETGIASYGLSVAEVSGVQETAGVCPDTDYSGRRTQIAVKITRGAGKFRMTCIRPLTIDDRAPAEIWLIRGDWTRILQAHKTRGGVQRLTSPPDPPEESAFERRVAQSRGIYEAHNEGNALLLQDWIDKFTQDQSRSVLGGLCWIGGLSEMASVADHQEREQKAIVFDNKWSEDHVGSVLKKRSSQNRALPTQVIFNVVAGDGSGYKPAQLAALYRMCETIRDGRAGALVSVDGVHLPAWRPAVFVYADFYPDIINTAFDLNRWAVATQDYMNNIGHILTGRAMTHQIRSFAPLANPTPHVVDLPALHAALSCVEDGGRPGSISTPQAAARALFDVFSIPTLTRYWRAGLQPIIQIIEVTVTEINPTAMALIAQDKYEKLNDHRDAADATIYQSVAEVSRNTRIGKVIIRPVPMDPDVQRRVLRWLDEREAALSAGRLLRLANSVLISRGERPVTELRPAAVEGLPETRGLAPGVLHPHACYGPGPRALAILDDFLASTPLRPMSRIIPGTAITADRVIARDGRRPVVIEVDEAPAGGPEVYRTLRILKAGGRVIRLLASDILGDRYDWRRALLNVLEGSETVGFVRDPRLIPANAWADFLTLLARWQARPEADWPRCAAGLD